MYPFIYTYIYIYIDRLKAGGSPELRGTLSLDAYQKGRSCIQMWGGGGGVITSCEVRWMMLNPGRCCLVGRCCYVASFEWLACSTHLSSSMGDVKFSCFSTDKRQVLPR